MPVYSRYIRTSGNNRMALLASWRTDIFTAYKKPGIFAVSCVLAYRQSVGIFKHVGFLPYVRRSVNLRYIRRRTIVRLWVMGVQWIWDYCWHIAGIFADILAWRRIYQEYVGFFCLQWRGDWKCSSHKGSITSLVSTKRLFFLSYLQYLIISCSF